MNWTGFESSGYSCIDDTGYDLEEEVEEETVLHQNTVIHDLNQETVIQNHQEPIIHDLNEETVIHHLHEETVIDELSHETVIHDLNQETSIQDDEETVFHEETVIQDHNEEIILEDHQQEIVLQHDHQQPMLQHYVQDFVEEKPSYSVYKRKYDLLKEKLESVKQDTVSMVHRISKMKRVINKSLKERSVLMAELDKVGDDYASVPVILPFQDITSIKQEPSTKERKHKKIKVENDLKSESSHAASAATSPGGSRDPDIPKRPQNPFFQFCKEKKEDVAQHVLDTDGVQLSKKELTKLLAQKWSELTVDEKQVYNEKFEEEKLQYNIQMADYNRNRKDRQSNSTSD